MFTWKTALDERPNNKQLWLYQELIDELRHRTGKNISTVIVDELFDDVWTLAGRPPKVDELSCAELDIKLEAEWAETQHKKKMLNHQEKWRSKKNRRFTGYHSGKR